MPSYAYSTNVHIQSPISLYCYILVVQLLNKYMSGFRENCIILFEKVGFNQIYYLLDI